MIISVSGVHKPDLSAGMFILRHPVIYPFSLTPVNVDSKENLKILQESMAHDRSVAVFYEYNNDSRNVPLELPELETFKVGGKVVCRCGVLARVVRELQLPDGSKRIVLRGLKRIAGDIADVDRNGIPRVLYRSVEVQEAEERDLDNIAKVKNIISVFNELHQ